jgi:superfamily I DNA/RNA helicase
MEILATEAFLASARKSPTPVREELRRLVSTPPGAPAAAELADHRVLGFSVRARDLALWYVLDPERARGPAEEPSLASMSKSELRELGVAEAVLQKVQQVRTLADLAALGLSDPVAQRLRFVLIQRSNGLCAREDELRYRATDLSHFDRYLHGDLRELLLNLDPSQRQIVELGGSGPVIVRGVAGSGKTTVALHRIYQRLRQRTLLDAPRILFLTFNRALAAVARELLVSMGLRPDDVEVSTLHKWCWSFAACQGRLFPSFRLQREALREACASVEAGARGAAKDSAIWTYPHAFWAEEIHRLKGSGIDTPAEYLELYRYGAGRALDHRLRTLVFRVYEAYRARQEQRGWLDWDDVVRLAFERIRRMGAAAPRYDHVLVDEAQDLTVMAMRLAAALRGPKGTLLVSYDPAQSIYERGFRWKSFGISVHGSRSFDLRRNFRNTAEILAAARPLLGGMRDPMETGGSQAAEGVVEPEQTQRHGPPPRFLAVPRGEECAVVAAAIAKLIAEEGVPPQNIAVLCYPNAVRDRMRVALQRAGVLCQQHDEDAVIRLCDPSVKVLPLKSAKGLEFPAVFLLASGTQFKPPLEGETEQAAWLEQMGRCFYMAMTRAMERLIVVYARGDPASFLRPVLTRGND